MPSTEGLKLLVRKTQPDFGEWLQLLEARRVLLKPHLDSVSLPKLGDVVCLRSEGRYVIPLHQGHPTVAVAGNKDISLETQGVFSTMWKTVYTPHSGYQAPPGDVSSPDGIMHGWGLTRSAHWVLIRIEFKGEAGYKNRGYQTATAVNIEEATPARIVEKTGYTSKGIWEELGVAAHDWLSQRQRLYRAMEQLAQQVNAEAQALSLIPPENN